mgnify:CR=1 FL=1
MCKSISLAEVNSIVDYNVRALIDYSLVESVTNLLIFEVPKGSAVSLSPSAYVEMLEPAIDAPDSEKKKLIARAYYPPTTSLKIEWSAEDPKIRTCLKKAFLFVNLYLLLSSTVQKPTENGKVPVPASLKVSEQVLYDINSDGFISITAAFAYGITLGKQSKFQIRFDEEVKVLDVMGENIDRWEISHPKATGMTNYIPV